MAQRGTVEEVKNGNLLVKIIREGACAHCQLCDTGINQGKECLIEAVNKCGAKPGDIVEIDVQPQFFLRATAIMYGLPLLALLAGIALSLLVTNQLGLQYADGISGLVGIIFTGITYLVINKRERNNKNSKYIPIAISKCE